MNWHYVDGNGQQAGPVDDAGLDALIATGTVRPDTLVWREGMANWQPASTVKPMAMAPVGVGGEEAVCAECGGIFPINDTIRVGNARVCANCKPKFVQKMREGLNVEQPAGALNYAGFWVRFAAWFVDTILLFIVGQAVRLAFGLPFMTTPANQVSVSMVLIFVVAAIQIGIRVGYETFMVGRYGATLGKMACKVHVVVSDGTSVSYLRAFGRYFAKIVSAVICAIGYIMAGFDSEKRALHDRMCNTRVVFNQ
jgi:uncharacterized RDD family membrane protein YckC